jgi:hypothetical protein
VTTTTFYMVACYGLRACWDNSYPAVPLCARCRLGAWAGAPQQTCASTCSLHVVTRYLTHTCPVCVALCADHQRAPVQWKGGDRAP